MISREITRDMLSPREYAEFRVLDFLQLEHGPINKILNILNR